MTFCPTCGQQTDDEAAYCGRCGMPLTSASAITQAGSGMVQVNKKLRSAVNFFSPKCQHCKAKGEIVYVGYQSVRSERGFGIVTREETKEVRKRDIQGRPYTQKEVTNRQERVPVVRTTVRYHYRCVACNKTWFKDEAVQQEDFSAPTQQPATRWNNVVYTREVVKIPCRYCNMLIDPVRDQRCPSCGANLAMGR